MLLISFKTECRSKHNLFCIIRENLF